MEGEILWNMGSVMGWGMEYGVQSAESDIKCGNLNWGLGMSSGDCAV